MSVLAGKVALVTGASRGVGAAIADALADEGAAVVVNYLKSEELAEGVAAGIRGRNGRAFALGRTLPTRRRSAGWSRGRPGSSGP